MQEIEEGTLKHLVFIPSRDVLEGDVKLFGIMVRQQGKRLIIIMKIYEENRIKEILAKTQIVVRMMSRVTKERGIEIINVVDSKDIIEQLSRHKIDSNKFGKNLTLTQEVTVEVTDLFTGEYVPIEFDLGMEKLEKDGY